MNRIAIIVALGIAAAIAGYSCYLRLHASTPDASIESQMAWMRSELKLSDSQYARIKELHLASGPRLRAMSQQVASMRAEYDEFEQQRRSADRVDFVEFAEYVESRRSLDHACIDSTRSLVLASADEMTPRQRAHYLDLIRKAEPLVGALLN